MVKRSSGRYQRLGVRYGWLVWGTAAVLAVGILLVCFFVWRTTTTLSRTSLVLASDPIILLSWGRQDSRVSLIRLPADTVIEAVHGYGAYSLEAIWRLGDIHSGDRALLPQSLQEALGIPVEWYIGRPAGLWPESGEPLSALRQIFSLRKLPLYLAGTYRTNVSLPLYVWLWRSFLTLTPDRLDVFDLSTMNVTKSEVLPDGSSVRALDADLFDAAVSGAFEDSGLRGERLSLAVYNTTGAPGLGESAGRLLGHLGILVVTVGNDSPAIDRCQITGNQEVLGSQTVAVVSGLFHCQKNVTNQEGRADVVVRLGRDYERLFAPDPR